MKPSDWQNIENARDQLGLGERATLQEIKSAFRRLSKQHHPDLSKNADGGRMQEIHQSYETLMKYVERYRFPLTPAHEEDAMEAEDWWMDRFGQDPLWGKG